MIGNSSILNLGIIVSILSFNLNFITYLLIILYLIGIINIFSLIINNNLLNNINNRYVNSWYINILFIISILSLIGIPPTTGFFIKYYSIWSTLPISLSVSKEFFTLLFILLGSIISTIFYLYNIIYIPTLSSMIPSMKYKDKEGYKNGIITSLTSYLIITYLLWSSIIQIIIDSMTIA